MLGSLDFYRYTGNIVEPNIFKSGFCSIQFTVTLPGHRRLIVISGISVKSTIAKSGFHCKKLLLLTCRG